MGSKRRGKRGGRGSGEGEGQEVRRLDGRVGRARPLTLIRNCLVLRICIFNCLRHIRQRAWMGALRLRGRSLGSRGMHLEGFLEQF